MVAACDNRLFKIWTSNQNDATAGIIRADLVIGDPKDREWQEHNASGKTTADLNTSPSEALV